MRTHAGIYRQLSLLFPDLWLHGDRFVSTVEDELPVFLEVVERHPYTTELRVTHARLDGRVSPDPDAWLRISHDAEVAEALYCYPREDVGVVIANPESPPGDLAEYRYRCNRFVERWLDYLLSLGHSLASVTAWAGSNWPLVTGRGEITKPGLASVVEGRRIALDKATPPS